MHLWERSASNNRPALTASGKEKQAAVSPEGRRILEVKQKNVCGCGELQGFRGTLASLSCPEHLGLMHQPCGPGKQPVKQLDFCCSIFCRETKETPKCGQILPSKIPTDDYLHVLSVQETTGISRVEDLLC